MKKIILTLLLGLAVIAGMPSGFALNAKPEGMCPVMPGHKVKQKFYVDYQGRRIYFCCRGCVKAFKKHPERYLPQNLNAAMAKTG